MITLKTNEKYASLFKKAWDELYYRDKFYHSATNEELTYYHGQGDTFNTIEDYFTKIKTLVTVATNEKYPTKIHKYDTETSKVVEIDNPKANQLVKVHYEFMMLPIDEPRFEINADTRDIIIPANFKKLVGVQGDHVAETLIFSINRYFDFIDLYRDDMKIYVQWTDEDGNDKADEIVMKYYDPEEKKIIFGWSLSSLLTKKARTISFAVRFLLESNTVNPVTQRKDLVYSLNTKVHQITIVPALQPDLSKITVEQISSYFMNAINDSTSADASVTIPSFAAPGTDLNPAITDFSSIKNGTSYILEVQAVAEDQGSLEYSTWTYRDLSNNISSKTGTEYYKEASYNADKSAKTKYYTKTTDTPVRYVVSTDPANEEDQLYERYWRCVLDDTSAVAGSFSTSVRHRNGNALSSEVYTKSVTFPGPGDVALGDCLQAVSQRVIDSTTGKANISTEVERSSNQVVINGTWEYSADNTTFASMTSAQGTSNFNGTNETLDLTAKVPGWYRASITGTRNNVTSAAYNMKDRTGTITDNYPLSYRITNLPTMPVVASPAYDAEEPIATTVSGKTTSDIIDLTVTITDSIDTSDLLESDGLVCKWYGSYVDSEDGWEEIVDSAESRSKYYIATGASINSLTLKVTGNGEGSCQYYCAVYNTLNGHTSAPQTGSTAHRSGIFVIL